MKKNIGLIILAGGKGVRMNQDIPKVLTEIDGVSLIEKLLENVNKFFSKEDIYIVVGYKGQDVIDKLDNKYNFVWQREQLGTGHAVMQCREDLIGKYENILILYGDTPFITEKTMKSLVDLHLKENSVFSMITLKLDGFENENVGYFKFGRIVRDESANISKIVEFKDSSENEKKITEVNPAIYCMKDDWLWENLSKIGNENAQNEYYLTDLVSLASNQNINIDSIIIEDNLELIGVNTQDDLSVAAKIKESRGY